THLASCADCRATEALLRRTVTELAALPAFEPSVGLRRRVLAEVDALPRPWPERLRAWFRPALLAPTGVAMAAAVVVAVVAGQHGGPPRGQGGAAGRGGAGHAAAREHRG